MSQKKEYIRKELSENETLKKMLNTTYPDIKDEWRGICLPLLENILNKRYNQKVLNFMKTIKPTTVHAIY